MPRLIALLLLVMAGIGLAAFVARQAQTTRDKGPRNTYRPRNNGGPSSRAHRTEASPEDIYMMSRDAATGLRDPLTGAAIELNDTVWRCARCQSLYNASSIAALEQDNQGACVQCQGTVRSRVSFTG